MFFVRYSRVFPGFFLVCFLSMLSACASTPTSTPLVRTTPTESVPMRTDSLLVYKGHMGNVLGIAWSPDGKRLVSCSDDGTVQEWDAVSGRKNWSFTFSGRPLNHVLAIAWSPDGRRIAAGAYVGQVLILDAANGHQVANYAGDGTDVWGVAWSPDSKRLASGNSIGTVQVWDTLTGKLLVTYRGHSEAVGHVAWSPDGRRIASASYDGVVQVWDAATGMRLMTYNQSKGTPVWQVAWSPDGRHIVSGTGASGAHYPIHSDNEADVWDATTGQLLLRYQGHGSANEVYALAWSPDGKYIASGGDEQVIRVWDVTTGDTSLLYRGHTDRIWQLAWSPDGKKIASSSGDGTVRIWSYIP